MRRLPPEAEYLPFEAGPHRMAMSLVTVPEPAWFELDAHYPDELRQRRTLLAERHDEVFAALPGSAPACQELLDMMVANLTTSHPDWFAQDGRRLHNRLTGEAWALDDPGLHRLALAGLLVQEDLCIIQLDDDGTPLLTAAILCFPSRWRLHEKIGKPLAAVHGPVPLYADRLERPVDRFMRALKPGHIASRLNWSIPDDPALFQPRGKWRQAEDPSITAENAGERLFLRVERQTLRRLPQSGAVAFGIRVHNYALNAIVTTAARAGTLIAAVEALPHDMLHYKSMLPFRDALLQWLASRSG